MLSLGAVACKLSADLRNLFPADAGAVIGNRDDHILSAAFDTDIDVTDVLSSLKSVYNTVFHQRLDQKRKDLLPLDPFLHIDLILNPFAEAVLLNLQIILCQFHLLTDRHIL